MYIKLFYALSILLFSFNCNAFSNAPDADGVVSFRIVNNTPCLYIERVDLIGAYFIDISQGNADDMYSIFYENTFEENYPTKEKCIMLNSSNFPNLKLKDRQIYAISLRPDPNKNLQFNIVPNFIGFGNTICLKKDNNNQFIIQDYTRGKCVDRASIKIKQDEQSINENSLKEEKTSWFEWFIQWIKKIIWNI